MRKVKIEALNETQLAETPKVSTGEVLPQHLQRYFYQIAQSFDLQHLIRRVRFAKTTSDGLQLHIDIIEATQADAPVIVFIPGTAVYSLVYIELYSYLVDAGYTVVGFDPRGHGRSEGIRGDYTIETLMRDTQAVITYALETFHRPVSLMGSSQGGITAFYVACVEDRIDSVICQSIADMNEGENTRYTRSPGFSRLVRPILSTLGNVKPDAQIPIYTYLDLNNEPLKHYGKVGNFLKKDPLTLKSISVRALNSLANTPMPCAIEEFDTPILVLQPARDSIFPIYYTEQLFERIAGEKHLEIFPDYTHAMMHNNAEEVAAPVIKWLDKLYHTKKVMQPNKSTPASNRQIQVDPFPVHTFSTTDKDDANKAL